MVKYIGKLGTEAVGLTIITKLDFGRSSCHLAARMPKLNINTIPAQTVTINGEPTSIKAFKMRVSAWVYEGGELVAYELNGTAEKVDGLTVDGRRISIDDYGKISRI